MATAAGVACEAEIVRITVDGLEYRLHAGPSLLAALDQIGVLMGEVDIPHYCWHAKLSSDGSCRLCQVEIDGQTGLQTACNTPVRDGMIVHTRSEAVVRARQTVLEFLMLNHPLDCPVCDQAGECKLQDYAWRYGAPNSRSREPRRKLEKRIDLGPGVVLDRERCILCRRCVRFCREIPRTGELAVFGRGDRSVIGLFPGVQLDNAYSMNVVDLCPVGALTSRDFRCKARAWQLESVEGVCGGCARGCNIWLDVAKGEVQRYRPRRNDAVNDTWMCDAGRLSYAEIARSDRLDKAWIRNQESVLEPVSVASAISEAARMLAGLVAEKGAGVIAGIASPHATNEDLFAFKRLLDEIGTENSGLAVPHGEADELLICAEKAANATGARAIGFEDARSLLERIRGGGVDGIVILGHDILTAGYLDDETLLGKIDSVILIDTHQSSLMRVAQVVLPARHLAEKAGTLTNCDRRVQRVRPALAADSELLTEGEIVHRLALALGLNGFEAGYDLPRVSRSLAAAVPPFAGITIESLPSDGAQLVSDGGEKGAVR